MHSLNSLAVRILSRGLDTQNFQPRMYFEIGMNLEVIDQVRKDRTCMVLVGDEIVRRIIHALHDTPSESIPTREINFLEIKEIIFNSGIVSDKEMNELYHLLNARGFRINR